MCMHTNTHTYLYTYIHKDTGRRLCQIFTRTVVPCARNLSARETIYIDHGAQ